MLSNGGELIANIVHCGFFLENSVNSLTDCKLGHRRQLVHCTTVHFHIVQCTLYRTLCATPVARSFWSMAQANLVFIDVAIHSLLVIV